jgi:chromosome segregation ATPase
MYRLSDLDMPSEDVEVLREVVNRHTDRGVTAGEVKKSLRWARENYHITYRFDRLEERDLIETQQVPERGKSNQIPPRVAYPTDEGRNLVEQVNFKPEEKALEERVERLEKQIGVMRDTYGDVKERIVEIEERVEEYDRELNDIVSDVRALRRAFEREKIVDEEFDFAD